MIAHRWIPIYHDPMLIQLVKDGKNDYRIAEIMGFSKSTIEIHRTQLGLAANARPFRPPASHIERDRPAPKEKPDPLGVAQQFLPGFDRETMTRHGRPIKLDDAVRQTNAILKTQGRAQIGHKETWLV